MKRLVIKFGGTSVMDTTRIRNAAQIALSVAVQGYQVVTVVSAMGHTTDHLIDMATTLNSHPDARELDLLMVTGEQVSATLLTLAIQSLGGKAQSFTGERAGIITEDVHGAANIKNIKIGNLEKCLNNGSIAVVAGFQGIAEHGEITTLGRGGSDTTAIALAAALHAERCDIYTDVNGVYSADPRVCASARRIDTIGYSEMLELALNGAQVLNARSVAIAMRNNVAVRVRSTFEPSNEGTLVAKQAQSTSRVSGIACDTTKDCIIVTLNPPRGAQRKTLRTFRDHRFECKKFLLGLLKKAGIEAEIGATVHGSSNKFAVVIDKCDYEKTEPILQKAGFPVTSGTLKVERALAKVSVVSSTMGPSLDLDAMLALTKAGILITAVTRDKHRSSIFVPSDAREQAIKTLHENFFPVITAA